MHLLCQLRTQHFSLFSQINPDHAYPVQSFKIHFNIILLNLGLSNGHFPSGFSTRILRATLLSSPLSPYVPFNSSVSDTPKIILGGLPIMELHITKFPPIIKKIVGVNNLDGLSAHW